MANKTFRQASKEEWYPKNGNFPIEKLNTGSLQRIADALEVMTKSHSNLINERGNFKALYYFKVAETIALEHRIRSLKGVITKMRKGQK